MHHQLLLKPRRFSSLDKAPLMSEVCRATENLAYLHPESYNTHLKLALAWVSSFCFCSFRDDEKQRSNMWQRSWVGLQLMMLWWSPVSSRSASFGSSRGAWTWHNVTVILSSCVSAQQVGSVTDSHVQNKPACHVFKAVLKMFSSLHLLWICQRRLEFGGFNIFLNRSFNQTGDDGLKLKHQFL